MNASARTVLPLDKADVCLAQVGGKARSLAKLASAGLPVPPGFVLTTAAYHSFVDANQLQDSIQRIVADIRHSQTAMLASAATEIQSLFETATLSPQISRMTLRAYGELGESHLRVAVRSSATAEDLPELSFAGQQDTLLNVRGETALLDAVRRCWSSLWTARAIGYRQRMGIEQQAVGMAVVVQRMVPAEVSGVLFSANPTTGERSELLVNANYGLGESIVAGTVTPDTYVLDRHDLRPLTTHISDKQQQVVCDIDQGTVTRRLPTDRRNVSSLSPETLRDIATQCLQAEKLFAGVPQDIEWAVANEKIWLLQSRPITNLPPPPLRNVCWAPPVKGEKLIRRQVVENMPEPLSPLFEDQYLRIGLEQSVDQVMSDFGIRFDAGKFIERPMFVTVNGYAYCRGSYRVSWRLAWIIPAILYAYVKVLPKLLKNLISDWQDVAPPNYLREIERWRSADLADASDDLLLSGIRQLAIADAKYWFKVSIVLAAAKVTDGLLDRFLSSRWVPGQLTSGMLLRGFPSKTMEAQTALETIAKQVRASTSLQQIVLSTSASDLLQTLHDLPEAESTTFGLQRYLQTYGHQIYNLDFAQPTQVEDPLPILLNLKSMVAREAIDTPARQAVIARERDAKEAEARASLGPMRRWMFGKLLGWAQAYGPYREEALFYMGAAWPTLRQFVLEIGQRLVDAGCLGDPTDAFYLDSKELHDACRANSGASDQTKIVESRRSLREARKRLHPPGILPAGVPWKIGPFDFSAFETQKRNADTSDTMSGFAVSPGQVTGLASVILSPADFEKMRPDTILVCPTTTPAWTPLFSQASGLVTDIGGILAHGSIVAREFGIPAVMGTGNGTQRITDGQRITVDGNAGTVTLVPVTRSDASNLRP